MYAELSRLPGCVDDVSSAACQAAGILATLDAAVADKGSALVDDSSAIKRAKANLYALAGRLSTGRHMLQQPMTQLSCNKLAADGSVGEATKACQQLSASMQELNQRLRSLLPEAADRAAAGLPQQLCAEQQAVFDAGFEKERERLGSAHEDAVAVGLQSITWVCRAWQQIEACLFEGAFDSLTKVRV